MAERALPAASAPRTVTVTVRVRSLVIAAAVAAALGLVAWAASWVTGLQPLAQGSSGTATSDLTDSTGLTTGPPVYIVSGSHPQLVLTLGLHNSASVPVTVTGIDPIGGEGGPLTRVRLGEGDPHNLSATGGPFHPVRIPADGYGTLTLVFGVNPAVLSCGQIISLGDVTFRFTTLGVIHGTRALDLGDQSPSFAGPCQ